MKPQLIDSHTHVQFPAYKDDREAVIARALEKGIWMVNIGTHFASSQTAIAVSEKYAEGVYASVGFHPGHIDSDFHDENEEEEKNSEIFDPQDFREIAKHPKVVGIGECGLDFAFVVREQREHWSGFRLTQFRMVPKYKIHRPVDQSFDGHAIGTQTQRIR